MKLRYYADGYDRNDHEEILKLLKHINSKHGIEVEVERINKLHGSIDLDFPGEVRNSRMADVYDRDFRNNLTLSRTIGEQPSRVFRTRYNGLVGIIESEALVWATQYSGSYSGSGRDPDLYSDLFSINFLKQVLSKGVDAITEKYERYKGRIGRRSEKESEQDLINSLMQIF